MCVSGAELVWWVATGGGGGGGSVEETSTSGARKINVYYYDDVELPRRAAAPLRCVYEEINFDVCASRALYNGSI